MSNEKLDSIFKQMMQKNDDIQGISLSTVDGFTVDSVMDAKHPIEDDKLSAVVSSLASLSNAAAQQVINAQLLHTVIETQNGDILIISTQYQTKPAVLCVITGTKQNLGKARYYALQLARAIVNIPVS